MYTGAIAGMILFGAFGVLALFTLIAGWSEMESWGDKVTLGLFTLVLVLGFVFFLYAAENAKNREPVISSCDTIRDGSQIKYLMTDSTLRCYPGKDQRYSVMKSEAIIMPDEQTPCRNCDKTMLFHNDSSSVKTEEEIEAEIRIQDMAFPS